MRSWNASRRVWWVAVPVAVVAVGLVAALAGWLPWSTTSRDAAPSVAEPLGARQLALLDRVVPRSSCPRSAPIAAPKRDQLVVDHARVENGCLVVRGEVVPAARADRRIRELRADPGVVAADLRGVLVPEADPPKLDELLDLGLPGDHLGNLKHLDDFDAEARSWHLWGLRRLQDGAVRHAIDRSRPPVTVAIIDTDGIDREHPELRGVDVTRYDGTPDADGARGSHATAVASVIAARDDTVGFTGLMPYVKLLSAKGSNNALADQIAWAVNQGARVVNMSVRTQCDLPARDCGDQVTQAAVRSARAHGVVLVAASGNHRDEGSPVICPACYEGVIGVGGHDRGGKLNESMSVNETVDISAPGTDVLIAGFVDTDAGARCRRGYTDEHDLWCTATGTSIAAPLVTAVVAWLVNQHPAATATQLERAIYGSADPAAEHISGQRNDKYGWGYLNPLRAREELARSLTEDRKDHKYVAYRSGHPSTPALSVLDPVSGRSRMLSLYGSPVGPNRLVVRWSPDGRYLAALGTGGTLHWWDMTTLDMTREGNAYDEATVFTTCECFIDFVFTDRNTIVALEGTQGVSGMHRTVGTPGRSVHRIDVRTGKEIGKTPTPELSGLVGPGSGPGSVLGLHQREPGEYTTVTDLVWLDRDGRETRRAPLNKAGWVDEPMMSPDANRLAYSVYGGGFPEMELRLLDVASGTITDVPHPFGGSDRCQCGFTQVRWQAGDTLVVAPWYLDPVPRQQTGLRAFHSGQWHRIDSDPLLAAVKIRPFLQVLLVGPPDKASLYLLRTGPFGEPDDVYAEPASRDRPVATEVSQIWVSPGGGAEPPLVLD